MNKIKAIGIEGLVQLLIFFMIIFGILLLVNWISIQESINVFSEKGFKSFFWAYWIIVGLCSYIILRINVLLFSNDELKYMVRVDLVIFLVLLGFISFIFLLCMFLVRYYFIKHSKDI